MKRGKLTVPKTHQITRDNTENKRQLNFTYIVVNKADLRDQRLRIAVFMKHFRDHLNLAEIDCCKLQKM